MQYVSDKTDNTQVMAPDEVSVRTIITRIGNLRRYLLSKWPVILLATIIGGGIGIAYSIYKKPVYTAECTFVLLESEKSGGGLSQYSDIAASFGVDLGGSSGGLFQGENLIQLYQSRLMVQKTLLTKADFNNKSELLIDRYIEGNKLRQQWAEKPKLKNISFDIPQSQFTLQHDSIITGIVSDIVKNYMLVSKLDKKLSIVSVKVKSKDELFAKAFTESIVSNVNDFYVHTKIKTSLQTVNLLQRQSDSIRRALNSSLAGVAGATDYNPNPNPALQSLRVPAQKKQIDVQANSTIYAEIMKNLELARGSLARETPLIQVIDEPILPLPKVRTGKLFALATGMFVGLLLSSVLLTIYKLYKKLMY